MIRLTIATGWWMWLTACAAGAPSESAQEAELPPCAAALRLSVDRADGILAAPDGFARDASALVGSDRVVEYALAVHRSIEDRLAPLVDRCTTGPALDTRLTAEVDAAIEGAYARPYDGLEPWPPRANDEARGRHVAADALLLWLDSHDLSTTPWERPLEFLTRVWRDQHLTALRFLREQAVPTHDEGGDTYATMWLGAAAVIQLDRATGEATSVRFEFD